MAPTSNHSPSTLASRTPLPRNPSRLLPSPCAAASFPLFLSTLFFLTSMTGARSCIETSPWSRPGTTEAGDGTAPSSVSSLLQKPAPELSQRVVKIVFLIVDYVRPWSPPSSTSCRHRSRAERLRCGPLGELQTCLSFSLVLWVSPSCAAAAPLLLSPAAYPPAIEPASPSLVQFRQETCQQVHNINKRAHFLAQELLGLLASTTEPSHAREVVGSIPSSPEKSTFSFFRTH